MEAVVPISVVASSATMTITYPALARSRVVALILASLLSSLWWKSPPTDRYRLNGMSLGEGDRSEQPGSPSPTQAWAGRKPAANGYGTPTDYESGFWECADRNCWSGASLEHHRCHALPPGLHAACGSFRGLQGKHPREIRRLPARPNLQTFGSQRSACRPAQSTVRRRAATSGGPGSANPIQRTIAAGIEILTPSLASSPRIRMHLHLGFLSLPNRTMSSRTSSPISGLPCAPQHSPNPPSQALPGEHSTMTG